MCYMYTLEISILKNEENPATRMYLRILGCFINQAKNNKHHIVSYMEPKYIELIEVESKRW